MDTFRTEYKTILCDSNSKLGYNLIKMGKYLFVTDFNVIVYPPERLKVLQIL